jgi:hypothetical protein
MSNSRRAFLTSSIFGGLVAIIIPTAKASASIHIPVRPYCLSSNKRTRLLQKCGDPDVKVAQEACAEMVDGMKPGIIREVKRRLGLPTKLQMIPEERGAIMKDIGSSVDWSYTKARAKDWKSIQEGTEDMISNLVERTNDYIKEDTYISDIGIYEDDTLYRQRLFGLYMWVTLANAKGGYTYYSPGEWK